MPSLTFTYVSKCSGDHVHLDVKLDGVVRRRVAVTQTDIEVDRVTADEADAVAEVLLRSFCRKWWRDTPAGSRTLSNLRTALEAQEWVI